MHGAGQLRALDGGRKLICASGQEHPLLRILLERNGELEANRAEHRMHADHGHPDRGPGRRDVFRELATQPGALS